LLLIARTYWFVLIALVLCASARSASPDRNDRWPAFSPDGKLIGFERSQDGTMDVFISDTHGGEQRRLTRGPNGILSLAPAWFPNGRALIYTTSNRQGDYGSGSFYKIAASGGESRIIAPAGERGRSISPDGRSLLFLSKQWEVLTLDLETGAVTQLTHPRAGTLDTEAMWSPDGTKIAFGCGYDDATKLGPICVMNADGSGRHVVSHWPGANEWPTWSPDGKQIAFQSDTDDFTHGQIVICDADGTASHAITASTGYDLNETPDWSRDGRWIVFQVKSAAGYRIALIQPSGTGFHLVT
jgi:Tol biopolymer transport system component